MPEVQALNVSKIIAILVQRLGGQPQTITQAEVEQFDRALPTLFTIDEKTGAVTVEVQPSGARQ